MELRLIVLRTDNQQRLADFYRLLGCTFDYHQHGRSPMHYTTTIGTCVLEIYPLSKHQTSVDNSLRLGFAVEDFEATL